MPLASHTGTEECTPFEAKVALTAILELNELRCWVEQVVA